MPRIDAWQALMAHPRESQHHLSSEVSLSAVILIIEMGKNKRGARAEKANNKPSAASSSQATSTAGFTSGSRVNVVASSHNPSQQPPTGRHANIPFSGGSSGTRTVQEQLELFQRHQRARIAAGLPPTKIKPQLSVEQKKKKDSRDGKTEGGRNDQPKMRRLQRILTTVRRDQSQSNSSLLSAPPSPTTSSQQ